MATNYADANHNPVARAASALERTVSPGQTISLDATPTSDPDGDSLSFKWWQYHEADSAGAKASFTNADTKVASFVAPNEPGKQVHVILEVTDNGTPPLVGYQRVICNIR